MEAIYRESEKAIEALAELLGDDEWFFGEARPGLFDASVFAYTNLFLQDRSEWRDGRMGEALRRCETLIGHRRRIVDGWYGGQG